MSNYPGNQLPYQTPQGYGYGYPPQDPYRQMLAPARRAGILQVVLGSLGLLCGICMGVVAAILPEMLKQPNMNMSMPPGIDSSMIQAVMIIACVLFLVGGLLFLILGVFVIKASKGAIIASIVVAILAAVYLLVNSGVVMSQGNAQGGLFSLGVLAVMVWLIAWLFQASSAVSQLKQYQEYYAAQMMQQHQQHQQQLPFQAGFGQPGQPQQFNPWGQPQWPQPQPPQQQPPTNNQWPPQQ